MSQFQLNNLNFSSASRGCFTFSEQNMFYCKDKNVFRTKCSIRVTATTI